MELKKDKSKQHIALLREKQPISYYLLMKKARAGAGSAYEDMYESNNNEQ